MAKKQLPKKADDIAQWYTSLIKLADLVDYGPVKGTMVIKPYGYAIWENIQKVLNEDIKRKGVGNAYFPLFIPMSFLEKEKDHIDGFAPELAVVTHGGGEELEEPLVVRPTSETIMYNSYADWIQSWRDLPLSMNQWNNVVRWEKRTMPFIRTTEFLWQEGHTAHETHEEAVEMQYWAMDMYAKVYRDYLAIDGYVGDKSQSERFAGAASTLTFESLMPSGKVLQSCTSHDLGQHFSKVFNINFQDRTGKDQFVWQTSWGISTRALGALILAHGDDNGLRLPPMIAPTQVVIVPVKEEESIIQYGQMLAKELGDKGVRVVVDERDDETFGYKLNKWEVKGVPLILKIGAQEVTSGLVSYRRRDNLEDGAFDRSVAPHAVDKLLISIQQNMLQEVQQYRDENTRIARSYDEFKEIIQKYRGFVKVHWNDDSAIEERIKLETKATTRCKLEETSEGVDFYTGKPSNTVWLFAQSY